MIADFYRPNQTADEMIAAALAYSAYYNGCTVHIRHPQVQIEICWGGGGVGATWYGPPPSTGLSFTRHWTRAGARRRILAILAEADGRLAGHEPAGRLSLVRDG